MSYYELNTFLQALLMTLLFTTACSSVYAFFAVLPRRGYITKIIIAVCFLLSSTMVSLYCTEVRVAKALVPHTAVSVWFCSQPIIITIIALTLMIAYLIFILIKEDRYRSQILTRSSIKESLDKLYTGLCFSYKDGRVILMNHTISKLCHSIAGCDLQDANRFWDILSSGAVIDGVVCISGGEQPIIRLPDGKVWSFVRDKINDITQLVATDVTALQEMNEELSKKNAELDVINERLRKYGENVDELTRAKERLETKALIHRELGKSLLVTRHYLIDDSGDINPPLDVWSNNVAMLRSESLYSKSDPISMFLKAADAAGIKIELTGQFPERQETKNLFVSAAVEALVNAVRHANASMLHIDIAQNDGMHTISFTNDGRVPDGNIVEGGGLSSLRKKTEMLGGFMEIKCDPKFTLKITSFSERGDSNG